MDSEAAAWLDLWDRALPQGPRERRRELLACAAASHASLVEELEVGRANAQLLRLHCVMFGAALCCQASCPACAEQVELELPIDALLAPEAAESAQSIQLRVDDWELSFRVPTEADLDAAHAAPDAARARAVLLQRCVSRCLRRGDPVLASSAPAQVVAQICARMEASDPLAVLDIALHCPSCDTSWSSPVDPSGFLWTQLDAWARRLTQDVHGLARAYGWDERTILGMSPWRRQLYLDLVTA